MNFTLEALISEFLRQYIIGYEPKEIFTTSVAKINYVERESLEKRLYSSIKNRGRQVIVYGHSGGGKTTLIDNVRRKYRINAVESYCIKTTTVEQLIKGTFDRLNVFFESSKKVNISRKALSKIKADYLSISGEMSAELAISDSVDKSRVTTIQMTAERLADFIGRLNLIWIIDDFHKIADEEKAIFSQMLKVFSTQSKNYPDLKIICVGAERTAREVIDYDPEMSDRVAEVHVPLLDDDDIRKIVNNGFYLLGASIEKGLDDLIIEYSNNVGTIAHNLCYQLCEEVKLERGGLFRSKEIYKRRLEDAIRSYLYSKEDSFKQSLDKSRRHREGTLPNGEIILKAFVELGDDQHTYGEIYSKILEHKETYPQGNLTTYLKRLTSTECDEIIIFDSDANKFSFRNPFLYAYCKMIFMEESNKGIKNDEIRGFESISNFSEIEIDKLISIIIKKI